MSNTTNRPFKEIDGSILREKESKLWVEIDAIEEAIKPTLEKINRLRKEANKIGAELYARSAR